MQNQNPCNDCPFRKNSLAGWTGEFEDAEAIIKVAVSEMPFSCHSRCENETNMFDITQPQCVGRLLFASKMAKSFRDETLEAMRLEVKGSKAAENIMNFREMKEHHSKQ